MFVLYRYLTVENKCLDQSNRKEGNVVQRRSSVGQIHFKHVVQGWRHNPEVARAPRGRTFAVRVD